MGASGQYYSIYIGVSNGPTTAAISVYDSLPAGFTTSGAISATGGSIYGCPPAGSSNLSGCTIATGAYGPINITIPVNISAAAGSSATNYAYMYGGGDPNCNGGCIASTTNPVSQASPTIRVTKALGGSRAISTDQFTVQILSNGTVVNNTANSTSTGSGSAVTSGSGTTGLFTASPNTSYTINEVGSNGANLNQYTRSLTCQLNGAAAQPLNVGDAITPLAGDNYVCTITNTPTPAKIFVTQVISAGMHQFPVIADYTGTNGWSLQTLTSTVSGLPGVSTPQETLTAFNTVTQLTVNPPQHWSTSFFVCTDLNSTGNTGSFGTRVGNTVTIAAANVRAGSLLKCTSGLDAKSPF